MQHLPGSSQDRLFYKLRRQVCFSVLTWGGGSSLSSHEALQLRSECHSPYVSACQASSYSSLPLGSGSRRFFKSHGENFLLPVCEEKPPSFCVDAECHTLKRRGKNRAGVAVSRKNLPAVVWPLPPFFPTF